MKNVRAVLAAAAGVAALGAGWCGFRSLSASKSTLASSTSSDSKTVPETNPSDGPAPATTDGVPRGQAEQLRRRNLPVAQMMFGLVVYLSSCLVWWPARTGDRSWIPPVEVFWWITPGDGYAYMAVAAAAIIALSLQRAPEDRERRDAAEYAVRDAASLLGVTVCLVAWAMSVQPVLAMLGAAFTSPSQAEPTGIGSLVRLALNVVTAGVIAMLAELGWSSAWKADYVRDAREREASDLRRAGRERILLFAGSRESASRLAALFHSHRWRLVVPSIPLAAIGAAVPAAVTLAVIRAEFLSWDGLKSLTFAVAAGTLGLLVSTAVNVWTWGAPLMFPRRFSAWLPVVPYFAGALLAVTLVVSVVAQITGGTLDRDAGLIVLSMLLPGVVLAPAWMAASVLVGLRRRAYGTVGRALAVPSACIAQDLVAVDGNPGKSLLETIDWA